MENIENARFSEGRGPGKPHLNHSCLRIEKVMVHLFLLAQNDYDYYK